MVSLIVRALFIRENANTLKFNVVIRQYEYGIRNNFKPESRFVETRVLPEQ